jgi:hypothetical protein
MRNEYIKNKRNFEIKKNKNKLKSLHFKNQFQQSKIKVEEQTNRVEDRLKRFSPDRNK